MGRSRLSQLSAAVDRHELANADFCSLFNCHNQDILFAAAPTSRCCLHNPLRGRSKPSGEAEWDLP